MVIRMYRESIFKYKSKIYVCKKLDTTQDENMNEIENYAEPIKYIFNVQPVNASSEGREFGQLVNAMRVATIPKRKYIGKFNEYDKVYIDTVPSENEVDYGDNADYRIYSVRPQNTCIKVYFLKLVRNSMIGE